MTVRDVVTWLAGRFGLDAPTKIVVLSRIADSVTGERAECPVIDLSFDESDGEIHLLLNRPPWDHGPVEQFTVASFLNKLRDPPPSYQSARLVSGTWTEIDEEHVARIDWPFDGVATNDDDSCVAFVERPSPSSSIALRDEAQR
jgi:hypothetical protein